MHVNPNVMPTDKDRMCVGATPMNEYAKKKPPTNEKNEEEEEEEENGKGKYKNNKSIHFIRSFKALWTEVLKSNTRVLSKYESKHTDRHGQTTRTH